MPRLSDRAFKVIDLEIMSLHNQGIIDKLDSMILSSRLRSLQAQSGRHLTRSEVWESLCDVIPDIEPKILTSAAASGRNLADVRISVGVGAAAILAASTLGVDSTTASVDVPAELNPQPIQVAINRKNVDNRANALADNPILKRLPLAARFSNGSTATAEPAALQQAKELGWRAALKGKNPPHSAQHWRETASMWRQALVYLNEVPAGYADYAAVAEKIAFYQRNLEEIEGRVATAIAREQSVQVTRPVPSENASSPKFAKPTAEVDYLSIARRHGWQASLAGQDAPHPARKWADISRTWKQALRNLEQVSADSTQYEEAQQVKKIYQQNLAEVRDRYRQEQAASQSVASLQAVLDEIKYSGLPHQIRQSQNRAIVAKLREIPINTNAYSQAQQAIAQINEGVEVVASY